MANSFQVVDQMRPVPFSNMVAILAFVCFLLPITPLLLATIPPEELLSRLVGAFVG